jgi:hypothetical protein
MIVMVSAFSVLPTCALGQLLAQSGNNPGASPQHGDTFRFEVCDGENNRPLPNASVTLVLWQRENGGQRRKELEARTDENGVAVFPSVQVEKLTVSVEAKGYRSISRWINPKDLGRAIRIRLDKWKRGSG